MTCDWQQSENKIEAILPFWDHNLPVLKSAAFDSTVPMTGPIIGLYYFIRTLSN